MSDKPSWIQRSPRHFVLQCRDRKVDLHYEDAGFRSRWAVYVNDLLVDRVPEFMQARGLALEAAGA